jgi:hypothetical protein
MQISSVKTGDLCRGIISLQGEEQEETKKRSESLKRVKISNSGRQDENLAKVELRYQTQSFCTWRKYDEKTSLLTSTKVVSAVYKRITFSEICLGLTKFQVTDLRKFPSAKC